VTPIFPFCAASNITTGSHSISQGVAELRPPKVDGFGAGAALTARGRAGFVLANRAKSGHACSMKTTANTPPN